MSTCSHPCCSCGPAVPKVTPCVKGWLSGRGRSTCRYFCHGLRCFVTSSYKDVTFHKCFCQQVSAKDGDGKLIRHALRCNRAIRGGFHRNCLPNQVVRRCKHFKGSYHCYRNAHRYCQGFVSTIHANRQLPKGVCCQGQRLVRCPFQRATDGYDKAGSYRPQLTFHYGCNEYCKQWSCLPTGCHCYRFHQGPTKWEKKGPRDDCSMHVGLYTGCQGCHLCFRLIPRGCFFIKVVLVP